MEAPAALEAFFQRERPRLVGALSLYTGDALLAEELADEALLRVCERWVEVSRMQAPGAWVHRVGINLANSFFRRRRAERRARHRVSGGDDQGTLSMHFARCTPADNTRGDASRVTVQCGGYRWPGGYVSTATIMSTGTAMATAVAR